MFRYIEDAKDDAKNLLEAANDRLFPDVNIYTQWSNIRPPKPENIKANAVLGAIPGKEALAQDLYNAIGFPKPGPHYATIVKLRAEQDPDSRLWRYYISLGRGDLYRAYNIVPEFAGLGNCARIMMKGDNGKMNTACDIRALLKVRECLQLEVSGLREPVDTY
jgi:hypothetical protein